ncbi:MAG TPA: mechanosensitive ion channel domain-containing protein [Verrucomicrobiae bacterium]|nr:mechanosensitive ion channel domain-containing protein [Verrucomicrobiae bacterium]
MPISFRMVMAATAVAIFTATGTAGAVDWKFWEQRPEQEAPAQQPAEQPPLPAADEEKTPEKRPAKAPPKGEKPAEKPLTPRKLGDEIEQAMTSIDLYRSEIDAKKKELEELKEKRLKLAEIEEKLTRERRRDARRELAAQRDKLALETDALARRTAGYAEQIQARKGSIRGLETTVETLRQRQQAIYLRYLYRFATVIGAFLVAWGIAHSATAVVNRVVKEESRRAGLKKVVTGTVYAAALVLALLAGLENPAQLAAFVAVMSAGLAIAMKDLLSCCIGWFMLVFTRQIRVGDIIEIGPVRGRVTDISLLKTTIHEWKEYLETGRTIFFGNNFIFMYPLYNSSLREGEVLDSVDIRIPPGADWHRCVLELRQRGEGLRQYADFSDLAVVSGFEQGGAPLATITFRAKPDEIPRIRGMIGTVAANVIWDETTR